MPWGMKLSSDKSRRTESIIALSFAGNGRPPGEFVNKKLIRVLRQGQRLAAGRRPMHARGV
jgi:hypothetical protein